MAANMGPSPDRPISPKHMKTVQRNTRHFISRPIEKFGSSNTVHNGILFSPYQPQQHQKPPLLPLPITKPHTSLLPSRTRGLSCSPTNKNFNRSIKKSKPSSTSPKKEDSKKDFNSRITTTKDVSECLIIAPTNCLGPDPIELPKDVSGVLSSSSSIDRVITCTVLADLEMFSGSVFTLSPPPSSLPLPKFSLRPKLGCNAEAATGFDAGATDNLRRLLRLR